MHNKKNKFGLCGTYFGHLDHTLKLKSMPLLFPSRKQQIKKTKQTNKEQRQCYLTHTERDVMNITTMVCHSSLKGHV